MAMALSTELLLEALHRGGPDSGMVQRAYRLWLDAGAPDVPRATTHDSLGSVLREQRLLVGMTQEEVVAGMAPLRISQGQLSRWERSEGKLPDAGELCAWLRAVRADATLTSLALERAHHDRTGRA